jgi:hypothetical protein
MAMKDARARQALRILKDKNAGTGASIEKGGFPILLYMLFEGLKYTKYHPLEG